MCLAGTVCLSGTAAVPTNLSRQLECWGKLVLMAMRRGAGGGAVLDRNQIPDLGDGQLESVAGGGD